MTTRRDARRQDRAQTLHRKAVRSVKYRETDLSDLLGVSA